LQYEKSVEGAFRLALTGSPGTGKSTVSSLMGSLGYCVESVENLAEEFECIEGVDPEDGARPIDVEDLRKKLEHRWRMNPNEPMIIDGHLSHLLPVDCVVILRCRPSELRERLIERSYSEQKIAENVDWEILGGAWSENRDSVPTIEFDTSSERAEEIVGTILEWVADDFKPRRSLNPIDWVGREEV
jgi:adenylate kinase|tara:strand:+ start:524 stop:1084 length:561 start_codon:yes stop_codon:yes gene_type:complete